MGSQYFDRIGELGDPPEAYALLGAPGIPLDEWCRLLHDGRKALLHGARAPS